jgi:hypothetical protein
MNKNTLESVSFPLRTGERVLYIERWTKGWSSFFIALILFMIIFILCEWMGSFFAIIGIVGGLYGAFLLTMMIISILSGKAILTNQRIVVKRLPRPWTNKEIQLEDVEGLYNSGRLRVKKKNGTYQEMMVPDVIEFIEAYEKYLGDIHEDA